MRISRTTGVYERRGEPIALGLRPVPGLQPDDNMMEVRALGTFCKAMNFSGYAATELSIIWTTCWAVKGLRR
jgi:hypothetical protein